MEKSKEEKDTKTIEERLETASKNALDNVLANGIQSSNVDFISKLVDIYTDVKESEKSMYYGNYGNYGNRGMNYSNYGRRGYDTRYRGEEYLDGMYQNYGRYEEGRNEYNRGNYGAKNDTLKSLEYMLESMVDFVSMLKQDAKSQEEMELIRKYTRRISEM